jgi:hypothetical protein
VPKVGTRINTRTATLAVAFVAAMLAVFAAQAQAGSYDSEPPKAVLSKYKTALQTRGYSGGAWYFYRDGGCSGFVADNFGIYTFPKPDTVAASRRLHVRIVKPERSAVRVNAHPRLKDAELGGKTPAGQRQVLKHTLRPVRREGETVAWDIFFRVNEPDRDYYLVVRVEWERVPGTHISYGYANYGFHVKTR